MQYTDQLVVIDGTRDGTVIFRLSPPNQWQTVSFHYLVDGGGFKNNPSRELWNILLQYARAGNKDIMFIIAGVEGSTRMVSNSAIHRLYSHRTVIFVTLL